MLTWLRTTVSPSSTSASDLSLKVDDEKSLKLCFILKGIFKPCLLRLETTIVKGSRICCWSAQTFVWAIWSQSWFTKHYMFRLCKCAALITCSTKLHLLLICSISLLCSRLCPPIRDKPTIALVAMSNSIWKPIPIDSNGPKVKVNLTAGAYWSKQWQLAEDGLQAHIVWAQIHGGKRKKWLNLSLKNF